MRETLVVGVVSILLVWIGATATMAQRYESDNYTIDASVGNSFGGDTESDSYKMTSSGGESIIGNGAGGSYMLGQGYVAQLERSLQLTVQPAGLVGYYGLNDDADIVYDGSVYGNNVTPAGSPGVNEGVIGEALEFGPAPGAALNLGNPTQLQTTDTTISAWIKTTHSGGPRSIVKKDNNYFLALNFRKLILYDWEAGASCSSEQELADGQWHHVAVSIQDGVDDGSVMYIDGVKEADCTVSVVNNSSPAIIGNSASNNQAFLGSIDEIKLYNRLLSASEIRAEYQANIDGKSAGLAFGEEIIPGISKTVEAEAMVSSDAPGYSLTIQQDSNLTSGAHVIPPIASGSIGSPINWTEGQTTGLGFSLTASSGTPIAAKWDGGNAYASLPSTGTSFYNRSGYTGGVKDLLGIRYRLDVASDQPTGQYRNSVTYTGVMTP